MIALQGKKIIVIFTVSKLNALPMIELKISVKDCLKIFKAIFKSSTNLFFYLTNLSQCEDVSTQNYLNYQKVPP